MIAPSLPLLALASAAALTEAALLLWLLRRPPPSWITNNYRGARVIARAGATLMVPLFVVSQLGLLMAGPLGIDPEPLLGAALAAGAFLLLGWMDDTFGTPEARGLKGHLSLLLRHGKATTGLAKAIGGALAGLFGAYMVGAHDWTVVLGGAVVALSANAANSLDARPGRAVKAFIALALGVLAAGALLPLTGPWVILFGLVAATLVLAPVDLKERVMLGDSGANPLGCALGLTVVSVTTWPVWALLAALLLGFCLAADRWSLTSLIEATPRLKRLDEWGTVRAQPDQDDDGH